MKKNDYTKQQFARALKDLAQTSPLKSVTVQAIVEHCGFNRGTFYYHFYDKQELINWIYHTEITEPTREILNGPPNGWHEISAYGLNLMHQNKSFYLQALKMDNHNCLMEYIKTEIEGNYERLVRRYAEVYHPEAASMDMAFFSGFMANGAYAMLIKWVENGMQESPEIQAPLFDTIARHSMDAVIVQYLQHNCPQKEPTKQSSH